MSRPPYLVEFTVLSYAEAHEQHRRALRKRAAILAGFLVLTLAPTPVPAFSIWGHLHRDTAGQSSSTHAHRPVVDTDADRPDPADATPSTVAPIVSR